MTWQCGHMTWLCGHVTWLCGHVTWLCGHVTWLCGHETWIFVVAVNCSSENGNQSTRATSTLICLRRDESACVTLQRVPKVGGKEGELEDYWLKYRHVEDGEKEFPLRNKQVR